MEQTRAKCLIPNNGAYGINKFRCLFLGDAKRIEMAATEKDARKENMNNMRKNRAYQELKREMDQKRRAREKVRLFKDNVGYISIKKT